MIKIYYHIWTARNVTVNLFLIDDQLKRLQHTGLTEEGEVYCTISGNNPYSALDLCKAHPWLNVLECVENDPGMEYEGRTLKYLWRDTKPEDHVFYFHTKGLSFLSGDRIWGELNQQLRPRNIKALSSWRLVMETELLDSWIWRRHQLNEGADTLGCYFLGDPFYHYMGNFWWARGSHIRKLPDPLNFDIAPYPAMALVETSPLRIKYEQWLFRATDSYYVGVRDWPFHHQDTKEPGYSPGINPYEDDYWDLK